MDKDGENPTPNYVVGYGKPPVEYQFKKGEKRKARARSGSSSPSHTELYWQILQEPHRVTRGSKVVWMTKAELIVEIAFQLAEAGNRMLRRRLTDLLLAAESEASDQLGYKIESDPDAPTNFFWRKKLVRP